MSEITRVKKPEVIVELTIASILFAYSYLVIILFA